MRSFMRVVIRTWMRYITTDPDFSWAGTLSIFGAALAVGALMGLARLRRWNHGPGWWRFTIVALVLLGGGGSVMWPGVLLGAIAIGRKRTAWLP